MKQSTKKKRTTVIISGENYHQLLRIQAMMTIETGERSSLSEVVNRLIQDYLARKSGAN